MLDLALSAQDYSDLCRRGSVSSEYRRGKVYFKLRFRSEDGRQRVRYLGTDPSVARSIHRELQELQLHGRHEADLRRRDAEARRLLRRIKHDVAETIEALGFHYHGFLIRRKSSRAQSEERDSQCLE